MVLNLVVFLSFICEDVKNNQRSNCGAFNPLTPVDFPDEYGFYTQAFLEYSSYQSQYSSIYIGHLFFVSYFK